MIYSLLWASMITAPIRSEVSDCSAFTPDSDPGPSADAALEA